MSTRLVAAAAALMATIVLAAPAEAHVSLTGPAIAGTSQELTFGVGHGCSGVDTQRVRIVIPPGITSVRAVDAPWAKAVVEKDDTGLVKAVTWSKANADVVDGDPNYYKVSLRIGVPNMPFTKLAFATYQTCRTPGGVESKHDWIGGSADAPAAPGVDAAAIDPAPSVVIVPKRSPGWNKYVPTVAISGADLNAFFGDALIVWVANAAYSSNGETAARIKTEPNTQVLDAIAAGATVWVKY